jgi:hypothetical protein
MVQFESKRVHFMSKKVHFRELYPGGSMRAVSLDTVGKDCDQARISKEEPAKRIVCICLYLRHNQEDRDGFQA